MAKTKFFRVATSGATTDGRTINPQDLIDMAQTYDPKTYQARVNLEHWMSAHPDSAFGAYGDVLALKTEPVKLNVGGQEEERLGLYAQVEALDPLIKLKDRAQKLFTSIEVTPKFAGSGKAYLTGLAFTDNPASLGTEMMKFCAGLSASGAPTASPLHFRKTNAESIVTAAEETTFSIADPDNDGDGVGNAVMEALRRAFGGMFTAPQPPVPPVAPPVPAASPLTDPALQKAFTDLRSGIETAFAALPAQFKAQSDRFTAELAAVRTELTSARTDLTAAQAETATLRAALEGIPSTRFTPRPASSGGGADAALQTDC